MRLRILSLSLGFLIAAAVHSANAAAPVINEFVANHTGTDTNEFVEIFGDPSTDYSALTILEIEGDGAGSGVVDGAIAVGSTDAAGFWVSGYMNNMIENGTITLLLVEGFTGALGDDLDSDNDGVFDSTPFGAILDQISVTDGGVSDLTYGSTILAPGFDGNPFTPGGASRIPNGVDTDAVADWDMNDFDGAGLPSFAGSPTIGEALNTPGAANELFVPPADPVINEFVFNHDGIDDHEYVEIFGEPDTDYSHLTLISVEGDGASGGIIDVILTVGTTDANGFWVSAYLADDLENGSNTLLLGEGFFGAVGLDLDADNDGILNIDPFARLVDDVAVRNGNVADLTYSAATLLPGYDGNASTVGGASRLPNGTDTDAVADWVRNDFDGEGLPGFVGTPALGEALNTPGSVNLTAIDLTPPTVLVSVTPSVLWPPNHKFVTVCATVTATDDRDPAPTFVLTSITSNEPADGLGDGNTDVDVAGAEVGTDDLCFMLRAERAGGGNGREYTIVYTATDAAGNTAPGMAVVLVPHDQSGAALASVGYSTDGTSFDVSVREFAVVIPSRLSMFAPAVDGVGMVYVEGMDAAQIDPYLAYLGNTGGVLRPTATAVIDVTGDNFDDLVLYYPTKAAMELATGREITDLSSSDARDLKVKLTLGLHFESRDGTQYLVENVLNLGAPVSITSGATPGAGEILVGARSAVAPGVSIRPNPFNPSTTISFDLEASTRVVLRVFDVRGALVRTLQSGSMAEGRHHIAWDGRDDRGRSVSSGIYFVHMESAGVRTTHRAVLLK